MPNYLRGKPSMAETHPQLAEQFHKTKNGDLTPQTITAGTNKKLWWTCPDFEDHEWQTTGMGRLKGVECAICANRQVLSGFNDMATTHPEIAAELDRSNGLDPRKIYLGGDKKLPWVCATDDRHRWEASGYHRAKGHGCLFCTGQRALPGYNDMATTHPELAAQLDASTGLDPTQIIAGTGKKLPWICSVDPRHRWEAGGNKRINGRGCPICSGRTVRAGINDMATTHPELAAQLDTSTGLDPTQMVAGVAKKLPWICPDDPRHKWEATGNSRAGRGVGCPMCFGIQITPGINDMATTHPELAAQLDTSTGLDPTQIHAGTSKKLSWICPVDTNHKWTATGDKRVGGRGCPVCNKGWTIDSTRRFVKALLDSGTDQNLDPAEMWLLFQQNGLRIEKSSNRSEFVKALGTGRLDPETLSAFANGEPSEIDDLIQGASDATSFLESPDIENGSDLDRGISPHNVEEDGSTTLPTIGVLEALDVLESSIWASADAEAVEFLEASAIRKLWRRAYEPDQLDEAIEQSERPRDNEAAERPRRKFHEELQAALAMELPTGYDFRIEGKLIEPLLMQRHVATSVRDQGRVGNWSGTGAGKTLSAVLASRLIDADVSVVCCPNATVQGWKSTIENAFPSARVATKTLAPKWPTGDGPRYLVVNFEAFQQTNSEADIKDFVSSAPIDFVVVDEIHYAKQRTDQASTRRKLVTGLIAAATEAKQQRAGSDLRVLGMSATPVINNLREGISMLELITGVEHDDLSDKTNIPNAMRVYQKLTTLGPRWMPPYDEFGTHYPQIDITHRLDDVTAITSGGMASSMLALEQLLLEEKLETIADEINPDGGTVIYTEFVNGMVQPIVDHLEAAGFSVGTYTGKDKSGLGPFLAGDIDVLVGSSTIGTGVDGLQHVASKLIVACAPWTAAGYEQLVGRLVRTGQQEQVDVVFPVTYIETDDGQWSYDESNRLNRIKYKKTVADAAVDGVVPEGALRSPADAYKDAVAWLERLTAGDAAPMIERRVITVPLSGERVEVERRARSYGDFAKMNGRWNLSASGKTHARLIEEPEEWENYHTLYQGARKTWTWVPYVELAKLIEKGSKNLVVADFGCGEDLLGERLRGKGLTVHSYDHVSISENVTALDVGEGVPLDDDEIDVAVFSLSLMGNNNGDYLREAARVLAFDGRLHIVETASRLEKIDDIEGRLRDLGFQLSKTERVGEPKFVHLVARRTDIDPAPGLNLI